MQQKQIWFSPYTLHRPNGVQSSGALLRLEEGFSAIHPWTHLNDLPLDKQLESIKSNSPTSLAARALHYATIDNQARSKKQSLFDGTTLLASHLLVPTIQELETISIRNKKVLKIKIHEDLSICAQILNKFCEQFSARLRLDVNALFSLSQFSHFWESLSAHTRAQIEFVEDPCVFDINHWIHLSEQLKVPLAYDFYGDCNVYPNGYGVRICKPVVQPVQDIVVKESEYNHHICVTSSLDHPLGISIAAWEYTQLLQSLPQALVTPGITSFTAYQKTDFSEQIWGDDDQFTPALGTGFGFDDLLAKIKWQKL